MDVEYLYDNVTLATSVRASVFIFAADIYYNLAEWHHYEYFPGALPFEIHA